MLIQSGFQRLSSTDEQAHVETDAGTLIYLFFQEGFILKRKQKNKVFILIPAGVVLAGVIGGLIFWGTHHSGDDSVCQETVAKPETLQNADISATEQQIQELTQKEVADLLGISQSYISRLEKKIIKRLKAEIISFQ